MDERTYHILLTLAWLGEATKAQLRDLCCPGMSEKTLQRALAPAMDGPTPLVTARARHVHDGTAPKREAFVYALTEVGHKHIHADPAYPRKTHRAQYPAKVTNPADIRRLEHHLQATEAIVQLITLARQRTLSGVFVAREVRLDRQRTEPVLDAVIVLHVGGTVSDGVGVPWTKDAPVANERMWCFAIESDRSTEAPTILAAKARAYRAAYQDSHTRQDWRDRTGQALPLVLWVAPTIKRLEVIHQLWCQEWIAGSWLLATSQQLAAGKAWFYRDHERVELCLFASTSSEQLGVRHVPPTTTAPPPVAPLQQMATASTAVASAARLPSAVPNTGTTPIAVPASSPRVIRTVTPFVLPAHPRQPVQPQPLIWRGICWMGRGLLWAATNFLLALGWVIERSGYGLWWLLRALGRSVQRAWGLVNDASAEAAGLWFGLLLVVVIGLGALFAWPQWHIATPTQPTITTWVEPPGPLSAPTAQAVLPTSVASPLPTTCGPAHITASNVRLRPAAGTANTPIAKLAAGTVVERLCSAVALADGSRWVFVRTKDGKEGWVSATFVQAR